MTFPEKIQLATGLLDVAGAFLGYHLFSIYFKKVGKKFLIPFLKYLAIASACIGSHQIFEYLSLITNNQIIYKTGLIISISGMVFYLVSLEKLFNRDFFSKYIIWPVGLLAIYLFSRPVEFSTIKFHLEHYSVVAWSLLWFMLFTYWNVGILLEQKNVRRYISRSVAIMYMLCSMTISFLLSAVYSLKSFYTEDINICTTYPSVWCTFGVVQLIFVPFFLFYLSKKVNRLPPKTTLPPRKFFQYISAVVMITILTIVYLISTGCFNIEFILS